MKKILHLAVSCAALGTPMVAYAQYFQANVKPSPGRVVPRPLSMFSQAREQRTRESDSLDRLTVPTDQLPDGCRLRTPPPQAPASPFRSNPAIFKPAIGSDSGPLAFIHLMLMTYNLVDEKAARDAERAAKSEEERQTAFDRLMAKHVANVETCYAAFYREEGGSPEIGVYALRFKKPLTNQEAQRFRAGVHGGPSALRVIKGSVAIFAWSDAREDAKDLGCFEVVRQHLEKAELK
jgi:hypothetical protein